MLYISQVQAMIEPKNDQSRVLGHAKSTVLGIKRLQENAEPQV